MGIFPMKVFWCCVCSWSSPSLMMVFVMSTYSGAEYLRARREDVRAVKQKLTVRPMESETYVRFLKRASLGIMGDGAPSLSQWVGLDR